MCHVFFEVSEFGESEVRVEIRNITGPSDELIFFYHDIEFIGLFHKNGKFMNLDMMEREFLFFFFGQDIGDIEKDVVVIVLLLMLLKFMGE